MDVFFIHMSSEHNLIVGQMLFDKTNAEFVGKLVGERALQAGVTQVRFDRSGFLYHGRIKALADGARAAGLKF